AVEYCRENGVEFYAVNKNYPEEEFDGETARKIDADIYIDDKNIGGFPGWTEIYNMLTRNEQDIDEIERKHLKKSKRSLFGGKRR
ncbi:MAG: hydrolase, partial [Bacteroidota bacterium]